MRTSKYVLFFVLFSLLLPAWGFADELPIIYHTPHGLKDSTVIMHIPLKYFSGNTLDWSRLCKDYAGDAPCYLLYIENSHERNVFLFEKTQAPFLYVITKPEGGKAGITIVGGWNEN
jgi:hypothetical protein